MPVTIGAFNRPWTNFTLDQALEQMAAAGYGHVGFLRQQKRLIVPEGTPQEEIERTASLVKQAGLTVDVVMTATAYDKPEEEAVSQIVEHAKNSAAIGARFLLTTGGKPEMFDAYCSIARKAAAGCAEHGVMLTVKPHGGLTMLGTDCAEVVKAVDHPNFGVFYDPGNIAYYAGVTDPADVKHCAAHVVGVCVKDCVLEPKHDVNIEPGAGVVDFVAFFKILLDAGFEGPCVVECLGGDTKEDIFARALRTRQRLENLLKTSD